MSPMAVLEPSHAFPSMRMVTVLSVYECPHAKIWGRNTISKRWVICRATSSSERERLSAAKDLEEWLKKQGFPEQPVNLNNVGGMGIGCIAARNLEPGELAISIPENYTITSVDVANHPVVSHIAAGKEELIALTLWLIYERSMANGSPWYPYLRVLPEFTSSPLSWTTTEHEELLTGSAVLDEVKRQLRALQVQYDALRTSLENDSKGFPLEAFTFESFKAAFSVVLSRAIYLPSAELFALVPFADMVNHKDSCPALDYDDESQKVVLKVDKAYKPGEQVFTSYTPSSPNSELLIRYGFFDENNENDYVEVETGLVATDPLRGLKREILQSVGLDAPQKFPVFLNRFPTQLLTYVRLARIQDAGLFAKINFDKDVMISPENEYEVLMLLMSDCRTRLLNYTGTGTTEDEYRLLRSKKLSSNARMAAMLRLKEKRIITELIGALRNRLAPIRGVPTKSGLKDPNSDIKEMFDIVEQVASAPAKFFSNILGK